MRWKHCCGAVGSSPATPIIEEEIMLTNGMIPKGTSCPFIGRCDLADDGCLHRGKNHGCEFSCAVARAFEMMDEKGDLKEYERWLNSSYNEGENNDQDKMEVEDHHEPNGKV
jgi:hypothetical protein